jgi:NAD(P)H dehydrogenase (quinone)
VIAVTGATGYVGSRVAARLAEAGVPVRLVVRDAARAPQLPGAEVRAASGYGAGAEMRAALEGAGTVLLIPGAESPDRVQQHKTAVDAAVAAGARRIVYLSAVGAAPDSIWTLLQEHWQTEEHIRGSGLAWTFPRFNLYADFLPFMVDADGVIKGPAGDGRAAAVVRDDVAAAAAAVLISGGHEGQVYDLTGPEALSLADAAEIMSRLTGKPVRFHDESDEEAFASRAGQGSEQEVRAWVGTYWAMRDGVLEDVSPHVRELTGREPVRFADHLRARPDALDHVGGAAG